MEIISWTGTVLIVLANIVSGNSIKAMRIFLMSANILFVVVFIANGILSQIVVNVLGIIIQVYNLFKERKMMVRRPKEKLRLVA